MEKIFNAEYWILKKIRKLARKFVEFGRDSLNRFNKWLDHQYDLRVRWKKAQPYLQEIETILPKMQIRQERLNKLAHAWATDNQDLREASQEVLTQNQILSLVIGCMLEFEKASEDEGFGLTDFYEIFAQLPDSIKEMVLAQTNIDIESLSLGQKPPECFRQFGNPISEMECRFCDWERRCEMRKVSDEKLAKAKNGEIKPFNMPDPHPVINTKCHPVASPIVSVSTKEIMQPFENLKEDLKDMKKGGTPIANG